MFPLTQDVTTKIQAIVQLLSPAHSPKHLSELAAFHFCKNAPISEALLCYL